MNAARRAAWAARQSELATCNDLLRLQRRRAHYVYALRLEGGNYYVGTTNNLARRMAEHGSGRGAAWTKLHQPVAVIHVEECESEETARRRERELTSAAARHYGYDRVRGGGHVDSTLGPARLHRREKAAA